MFRLSGRRLESSPQVNNANQRTNAELPAFVRAIERLTELAGVLAAWVLATLAALMLAELAARNLFDQSLHFTWELSSYAMGAVFFLAAAAALRHADHVRVGIVLELLNPRAARWIDAVVTLLAMAVVAYLLYAVGALTLRSFSGDVRSWSGFRIPLGWPQLVLVAGILQFALQLVARFVRLCHGLPGDVRSASS